MAWTPLPIGVENFEDLMTHGYYYVDKTPFIRELLDMKGKVNLFTRPRRFGKTLNMSMLRYFLDCEYPETEKIFSGTKILEDGGEYRKYMGNYPVISVTLKSMKQATYEEAFYCLKEEIAREYRRHDKILDSLDQEEEREKFRRFAAWKAQPEEYLGALRFLSECLFQVYGKKSVILIDEYDVPLENAYFGGFYDRMVSLVRSLFESALKTNDCLEFAVITGCLRISKESIFTGLNNLKAESTTNDTFAEYFGFTQEEVEKMLKDYGLEENLGTVQKWYDGYCFGETEVYNPWSVINYVYSCYKNKQAFAKPYWSNTSSNSIVRSLIEHADISVKKEIEGLIEGKTIEKPIHEDITYEDMNSTQDNLWNFLFFTGYLKKISQRQEGETIYMEMAIPNSEVRYVYKNAVLRWFEEKIDRKTEKKELMPLYESLLNGDAEKMGEILSENLMETISFYDYQESYYHGFLAGLLRPMGNYIVESNRESGKGRPGILVRYPSVRGKAVILELKVAKTYQELEKKCEEALRQIEEKKYEEGLRREGYKDILKYGVAFYKKECMVKAGRHRSQT